MTYPINPEKVPYLTAAQMVEVDRAMVEDFRIGLVQMMENAGRNLAHLARTRFLDGDPVQKKILVLAGTGGNGGGALVAARHLHNWGARVRVFTAKPAQDFIPISSLQLDILKRMKVPVTLSEAVTRAGEAELIVDGIIGYSLKGPPHGRAGELIRWANAKNSPVLSLDVPSGIDATTGTVFDPAIRAEATMTLALPKEGLRAPGVEELAGELYLADISVPPGLYAEPSLALSVAPLFSHQEVIRLR